VIINLLTNAIKFAKLNDVIQVIVTVKPFVSADMPVEICIKVVDHGIGISPQDLKSLFQPYFRTTDEINRNMNRGSHGLGLSICKTIVEGMNG
jgi:signal transduction histidine kinase